MLKFDRHRDYRRAKITAYLIMWIFLAAHIAVYIQSNLYKETVYSFLR